MFALPLIPTITTSFLLILAAVILWNITRVTATDRLTTPDTRQKETPPRSLGSKDKLRTYRLRGIPGSFDLEQVKKLVKSVLSLDNSDEVAISSLAEDPCRESEKIATVELTKRPQITCDGKDEWALLIPNEQLQNNEENQRLNRKRMVLDTHFRGLTPLHSAKDSECSIDLIAVPGLGGHAFGSFKERTGSHMWLRDSLSHDLPNIRIFVYGYDSRIAQSTSFANFDDVASELQEAIRLIRNYPRFKKTSMPTTSPQRPLILISHSLGGVLVRATLIRMGGTESGDDSDKANLKSIRGILFFGVPNAGMETQYLLPIVGDQPNRFFVEQLGRQSDILRIHRRDFPKVFTFKDSEIISFYETKQSPTAKQRDDGTWELTGKPEVLLDVASATHGRPWETTGHYIRSMNRTHQDLVKFSSLDNEYERVKVCLDKFVENGEYVVGKRFPRRRVNRDLHELSKDEADCLKSLAFPEMNSRYHMDELRREDDTCTWLLQDPTYTKWLTEPCGTLYISGKPGCGKSTLMRFAVDHAKKGSAVVASFFFHGRGVVLQKTPEGLFRSLLHEIFQYFPRECSNLTDEFRAKHITQADNVRWEAGQLRVFLENILLSLCRDHSIILYIDALDEAGSEVAYDLAHDFVGALGRASIDQRLKLKICFSHREFPELGLPHIPIVPVDKRNSADIVDYWEKKVKCEHMQSELVQEIKSEVLGKAQGVFLWVKLVVKKAVKLQWKGKGPRTVLKMIKETPSELKDIYETLLDGLDDPQNTLKLFQWISFSERPLQVRELREAMVLEPNMSETSIVEYQEGDEYATNEAQMELKIKDLSRGLAEISVQGNERIVQFIHQSVMDFMAQSGFNRWLFCFNDFGRESHFQLSRSCLRYLGMKEIRTLTVNISTATVFETTAINRQFPLLLYSIHSWAKHLEGVEERGGLQEDLLDLFQWPSNDIPEHVYSLEKMMTATKGLIDDGLGNLLHLLAQHGIYSALKALIDKDITQAKANNGVILRKNASLTAHSQASTSTVFLEDGRVNLNVSDGFGRIPLHRAVVGRHLKVAKLLLSFPSVNPLATDHGSITPLSFSLGNGEMETTLYRAMSLRAKSSEEAVLTIAQYASNISESIQRLQKHYPRVRISRQAIESAMNNVNVELRDIETILRMKTPDVKITGKSIKELIYRDEVGLIDYGARINPAMLQLLLQEMPLDATIGEDVIVTAAREQKTEVFKLLLQRRAPSVQVTEKLIEAALHNHIKGQRGVLLSLFETENSKITITEGAIEAVAKNATERNDCLTVMDLLFKTRGTQIQITERILVAAAGNSIVGAKLIAIILKENRGDIRITERVVVAAAGNGHENTKAIALLLRERGTKIQITERVLVEAASSSRASIEVMAFLLAMRRSEIKITEPVLIAAVSNRKTGPRMFALLLEANRAEFQITEPVFVAAAGNSDHGTELNQCLSHQYATVTVGRPLSDCFFKKGH
ncbi:uncharacterized protein K441DRAFT_697330 [Cenococcum geophilum 1.58]|uniref:uncharacterized protein n=1 Tax=Cenococcum geophilum 1.58 TaxID=794803 RepID=UPI00358F7B1B|nr:hypothetical protein K441DRAFT_697330 [Cenococcum geophilum 1.58]